MKLSLNKMLLKKQETKTLEKRREINLEQEKQKILEEKEELVGEYIRNWILNSDGFISIWIIFTI